MTNNFNSMKSILYIFLIAFSTLSVQSQNIEGTYANKWVSNSGEGIAYKLTLQPDGNFIFNHTRLHLNSQLDTEVEVLGSWSLEGHLLVLKTDATVDDTDKIASRLDLNKARFVSVSSRDPKFNLVKPSLKFYESDIFYAKGMELIKTESSLTALE